MTKPTLKKILEAGRKGTTSSTRPKVNVLARRGKSHNKYDIQKHGIQTIKEWKHCREDVYAWERIITQTS